MHILHYITDFSSAAGPQASAVRTVLYATSQMADSTLMTCVPLSEDDVKTMEAQYGIKVIYTHWKKNGNPLDAGLYLLSVEKMLRKLRPDVVHVHGTWDWRAAMVERIARHHGVITTVSPHRGMALELIGIDFWKEKLPKLIAFQIWMVRNCTAVITDNEKERDVIVSLFHKRRIEAMPVVQNDAEGYDTLGRALMVVYRKCLDTVYGRKLTKKERNVVSTAVRALVADDDVVTPLPDVTDVSFRRIYFYAYDEDVMQQFIEGCEKMQLSVAPPLNMETVPRYRNPKSKKRGPLDEVEIKIKALRIPEDRISERNAVMLICKAKKLGLARLTLRHYTELYYLFRYSDFDEDLVRKELKRLHVLKFTKKMQKRLAVMYGLKDGYSII